MIRARQHNEEPERVVFRDAYNSEQETLLKSGIFTGVYGYDKGIVTFNNGHVYYPLYISNPTISIRFKFRAESFGAFFSYLCSLSTDTTVRHRIRIDQGTNLLTITAAGGAIYYLNGEAVLSGTQVITVNEWYDFVLVASASVFVNNLRINCAQDGISDSANVSYSFIEIWNTALSAQEVANLYSG